MEKNPFGKDDWSHVCKELMVGFTYWWCNVAIVITFIMAINVWVRAIGKIFFGW